MRPVLLFAFTLFLSASLMFTVELMVGKLVLPYLGGTPAVWNTCMVFWQALLLAGYAYAHWISKKLPLDKQVKVHAFVLAAPLIPLLVFQLNIGSVVDWFPPPGEANPIPWLLAILTLTVGLPFFAVATTASLLQRWYSRTNFPSAHDPYFLYGASNIGSMLALLSYPTLIEPLGRHGFGLPGQRLVWVLMYAALAALIVVCGFRARRSAVPDYDAEAELSTHEGSEAIDQIEEVELGGVPTSGRNLRWVALAFVPSSLMLGVTTHITTDIAAIPLIWVLPLALYLLSFILVFSRLPAVVHQLMIVLLLPVTLLVVFAPYEAGLPLPFTDVMLFEHAWEVILLHLVGLFVVAMVCHGEMARTRPPSRYLTEFFLLMSLGGVLGGMFNALAAPNLFNKIVEYPLMAVLACLLVPRFGLTTENRFVRGVDLAWTAFLVAGGAGIGLLLLARAYEPVAGQIRPIVLSATRLPDPFGASAHKLLSTLIHDDRVIFEERNFFGYFAIIRYKRSNTHLMAHGTTTHGMQCLDADKRDEPLTYFHRTGPIGHLFEAMYARDKPLNVAVLGVGTGTLAAYMKKGWSLTLYEIDPAVVKVAYDPAYFTYLRDCEARGARLNIILGDGRLKLKNAPDGSFDMLFMDAFASDAVPVHLLTREAFEIYKKKLKPDGVLVVNIANWYLKFDPVLANLAEATDLKLRIAYGSPDRGIDRFGTRWVVLARHAQDLGILNKFMDEDGAPEWTTLEPDPDVGVWTDDYSNLLKVFRW